MMDRKYGSGTPGDPWVVHLQGDIDKALYHVYRDWEFDERVTYVVSAHSMSGHEPGTVLLRLSVAGARFLGHLLTGFLNNDNLHRIEEREPMA